MAPKVTENSNQTSVKTTTRKVVTKKKEINIAKEMMKFADDNTAAIGKEGFKSLLKQVNKSNIIDVIKQYDKISPDKSIIGMILSEIGSNDEEMKTALVGKGNGKATVRGLFTLLCDKAKDVGVDSTTIANFENEFNEELDKQLATSKDSGLLEKMRSWVSTDASRLDAIVRALVQTIDNQIQLSAEERAELDNTPATVLETRTNNILNNRYETALEDFNAQLQLDGWAGDFADAFSKIWNNELYGNEHGNTADLVRKDLNRFKEQIDELETARQEGDAAYKAKFKEIFGVAYNTTNIAAYQDAEARYILSSRAKAQEDNFNLEFGILLNSPQLQEEAVSYISSTSGALQRRVTASREQVYQREYEKFAAVLGKNGKEILEEKFKEAGVENGTIDEKFSVLKTLAKHVSEYYHNKTMKTTGGADFDSIQKQYDNCYKAAFGLDNDIMKRVTDYNISQQRGAGVVKGAVVAAVVLGCTLTGQVEGIVAVAGLAAGATATAEITDNMTQKRNIDAGREGGLGAYLKSVGKNTDWGRITLQSAASGAMCLVFAGQSYVIQNIATKAASQLGASAFTAAKIGAVTNSAAFVATGLGTEKLMTGEISVEGVTFTVIFAVVGGAMQLKSIYTQEALVNEYVGAARDILGFDSAETVTLETLNQNCQAKALELLGFKPGENVTYEMIQARVQNILDGVYIEGVSNDALQYLQTLSNAKNYLKDNLQYANNIVKSSSTGDAFVSGANPPAQNMGMLSVTTLDNALTVTPVAQEDFSMVLFGGPKAQTYPIAYQVPVTQINPATVKTSMVEELPSSKVRTQYNTVAKTYKAPAVQSAKPITRPCKIPSSMPSQKAQIQNVSVTVVGGDMTAIKADAFVVPEFPNCVSEGGVGGAIARQGAIGGLKAYDQHVHQNGRLEWGDVVVTESGGGKSTHLIHVASAGADAENSFAIVQQGVYNSLKAAQEQGLQSVVIPAMGTGIIGHLTNEQSAQAILAGINQFASEGGQIDASVVVYSTGKGLADFRNTLLNKTYETAKPIVGTKEFDEGAWLGEFTQTLHEAPVTSSTKQAAKVVSSNNASSSRSVLESETTYKPAGDRTYQEMEIELQAIAEKNSLSLTKEESLFGDGLVLRNSSGQRVRGVYYRNGKANVDMVSQYANGQKSSDTWYNSDGSIVETTRFYYDNDGVVSHSVKVKQGYDEVGVYEYNKQGRVKNDYYDTPENVQNRYGHSVEHTEILEAQSRTSNTTQASEVKPDALKSNIMKAAQNSKYDASVVEKVMNENPELVEFLSQVKDPNGKTLLNAQDISDILFNSQHGFVEEGPIPNFQARIKTVLSNPEEIANIADWTSKGGGVWRAIQDPLNSTVNINPEAFGVKPQQTSTTKAPETTAKQADKVAISSAPAPASVPKTLDTFKARANNPIQSDNPIVQSIEQQLYVSPQRIVNAKYVEFTGVNTPQSRFTVHEAKSNGKFEVTQSSKDPDFSITNMGGKYDIYYDKTGHKIVENYYNPTTNVLEETTVETATGSITKNYNADGTVKSYIVRNGRENPVLTYDAQGNLTGIYNQKIEINGKEISVDIERTSGQFARLRNESTWTTDANGRTTVEFRKGTMRYSADVNPETGLTNVRELGKATAPKTELSPEKAKTLSEAGFTEEVIGDLKLESEFYGPELIDEVLNMVEYLEAKVGEGTPITRQLIEATIDKFSPGASGGSAYVQRNILANTWNKGALVYKAYGQEVPEEVAAKANINPEAFGVKPKQTNTTQDFATKLASYKGPDGKQLLSSEEITNLLKNNTSLSGKPIENFEAKIEAVLSNPEEVAEISSWKSKGAGVWRAIQDPLTSTEQANPELFGV